MPILSRLRSRHTTAESNSTKQLVTFRLGQEWFALPLDAIEKVTAVNQIYGDPNRTGVSLTLYENREIMVVDVAYRIFNQAANAVKTDSTLAYRYLIIISNNSELIGLPVDSAPTIRRIQESAFTALPESYVSQGNIRCISKLAIQLADEPPIFLMAHQQLLHPETIVSNSNSAFDL